MLGAALGAVIAPPAGGDGTVSFTVVNSGGSASADTRISLGDALGASIVGGTAGLVPPAAGLRRASLFDQLSVDSAESPSVDPRSAASPSAASPSAATTSAATTSAGDPLDCASEPGACTLAPIAPGWVATVTLTIHVPATAARGSLVIEIGDGLTVSTAELSFAAGLSSLSLDAGKTLVAGTSTDAARLVGTPAKGVTDAISITIPRVAGDLLITDLPDTCLPDAAGDTATCSPLAGTTADYGDFGIALKSSADGRQDLTARLAGGQEVAVTGPTGKPLTATPIDPGDPIAVTGSFGGTQVGAEALACGQSLLSRYLCGLAHEMRQVTRPQKVAVPDGATVLSAIVTWAATAPKGADPASLDSVTLHVGDSAHRITGTPPAGGVKGVLDVRSADVTDILGSGGTVWVDDIASRATTLLVPEGPMAGWTLDVIWYDPSAPDSTVEFTNSSAFSHSTPHGTDTRIAGAGAPISSLTTTIWAADPWADKSVTVGGSRVTTPPIDGMRADRHGAVATGFDLISGITARSGQDVALRNAGRLVTDDLWIGPTMVIRQPTQSPPAA